MMPTCKRVSELATAYTEGHLPLLESLRVRLHLATCRDCRSYVRQLDITARALRALPEPQVSPELRDALLRSFDGWKASREVAQERRPVAQTRLTSATSTMAPRARAWNAGPVVAALAAFVLLVGLASDRSPSVRDWSIALALAAAASALAALSSRFSLGVVVAALSLAFAAALVGGGGPLALPIGLHCLGAEIASAAAVACAAWLALRPGPDRVRRALAAAAAAGAVAADAALQVTCSAHGSLPHLLVFHLGGVAAAASAAMLLLPRPLRVSSR